MFWHAVQDGLMVLLDWRILLGMAILVGLRLVYLGLMMLLLATENRVVTTLAVIGQSLGQFVFGSFLIAVFLVVFIEPINGQEMTTSFSDIQAAFSSIVIISIISGVTVLILSFIPIIGSFISESTSTQGYLQGVIIYFMFTKDSFKDLRLELGLEHDVYPSILAFIGFLLVSVALGAIIKMILILPSAMLFRDREEVVKFEGLLIGLLSAVLGGLPPLFMYINYVRLSFLQT